MGIDALREELKSDVQFTDEIKDRPWGTREFTIRDVNGYYLRFVQGIDLIEE